MPEFSMFVISLFFLFFVAGPNFIFHNENSYTPPYVNPAYVQPGLTHISSQVTPSAITVTTDQNSYSEGEQIVVSGTVRNFIENQDISIMVRNPMNNVIDLAQIVPNPDDTYSIDIRTGGSLWDETGGYTILVEYGSEDISAETTIQLVSSVQQTSVTTASLNDNFDSDSSLNNNMWQVNGHVGSVLGPAVCGGCAMTNPQISFSPAGMAMSGINGEYQVATIESKSIFSPPFTAEAHVSGTTSNGNTFFFAMSTLDASKGIAILGNLNSQNVGYYGINIDTGSGFNGNLWNTQHRLYSSPQLNILYDVLISVDSSGEAYVSIGSGAQTFAEGSYQIGTGPFYVILGQGEGLPTVTGPNEAVWQSLSVSNQMHSPILPYSTTTAVSLNPPTINTSSQTIVVATVTDISIIPGGTVSWSDESSGGTFSNELCHTSGNNQLVCTAIYTATNIANSVTITADYSGDSSTSSSTGYANLDVITAQSIKPSFSFLILAVIVGFVILSIITSVAMKLGKKKFSESIIIADTTSPTREKFSSGGQQIGKNHQDVSFAPTLKPRPTASGPTHGTLPANFKPAESPHIEKPQIRKDPLLGVQVDWFSLAEQASGETVIVNGVEVPKLNCYRQAAESNQNEPKIWKSLGFFLRKNQIVEINNKNISKHGCLLRAMNLGLKDDPDIWANLGESLESGETIDVEGKRMTALDCYLEEALLRYPQ